MQFLLNDEEQVIVRDLLRELYYRRTFDAERFYFEPPRICKLLLMETCNVDRIHVYVILQLLLMRR